MATDEGWDLFRWCIAVEAADTWRDPSERGVQSKTGDLAPLV